jgi:membrane protein
MKQSWALIRETFSEWSEDRASRLAASLAYYTVFCIAPLLVIIVRVAALVFGTVAARHELSGQLQGLMGKGAAGAVDALVVTKASAPASGGTIATLLSIAMFAYAATVLFDELQDSMNTIWEIDRRTTSGWWRTIRHQLVSCAIVLCAVLLFMASLLVSTLLPVASHYLSGDAEYLGRPLEVVVSLVVFTLVFATGFKVLPDAKVAWRDVWIGAAATAGLFTLGKYLIGLYLVRSSATSIYGATGAAAVLLIWVYYSAQVLFLGAEFTQVYARRHGRQIEPKSRADAGGQDAPENPPGDYEARTARRGKGPSSRPRGSLPWPVTVVALIAGFAAGRFTRWRRR